MALAAYSKQHYIFLTFAARAHPLLLAAVAAVDIIANAFDVGDFVTSFDSVRSM